jgi:hypothetical protein
MTDGKCSPPVLFGLFFLNSITSESFCKMLQLKFLNYVTFKITDFKTKPKKKYTRTKGHRQSYTRIQIEQLN